MANSYCNWRDCICPAGVRQQRRRAAERREVLSGPLRMLDPVARRRLPGILMACDAMLMVNSSTAGMQYLMTNKFFDYLASGRPSVANVQAELTDWILKTDCGVLADPNDMCDSVLHNAALAGARGAANPREPRRDLYADGHGAEAIVLCLAGNPWHG